ncbi:MAG: DUF3015 family protein [Pseudomonadota bacterium]|nr:DUF3015 family protein [Pseudomonadota bacterium]
MKKILLASVFGGMMMFSAGANAVDSTGCGLGSMAWRGQSGRVPQILAVTTNTSFGIQTFGITFGTSGCDPNGRITGGTQKMVLAFLENNMEQYAMDAARGQGETIDTLAGIMNVDSEKLGEVSKQNFAFLFPNQDVQAVDVTLNLFTIMS